MDAQLSPLLQAGGVAESRGGPAQAPVLTGPSRSGKPDLPLPQAGVERDGYFTAPDRSSFGTSTIAATSGHLRCHGLIAICVPAWRLIFQAR
jgi:hypothetical protein